MQNQIIITDINKPSSTALKAFTQQLFNDIQAFHKKEKLVESEVQSHD